MHLADRILIFSYISNYLKIIHVSVLFHNSEGWIGLRLIHMLFIIFAVSLICWDVLFVVKLFSTHEKACIFKYLAFYWLFGSLRMVSISNVYPIFFDNLSSNFIKFGWGFLALFSWFRIYFSSIKPFAVYY